MSKCRTAFEIKFPDAVSGLEYVEKPNGFAQYKTAGAGGRGDFKREAMATNMFEAFKAGYDAMHIRVDDLLTSNGGNVRCDCLSLVRSIKGNEDVEER